jgi:hypothetical protein
MGMDYHLAHICRRAAGCNFLACEVSEGAKVLFNSTLGVAFLDRVRRVGVVAPAAQCHTLSVLDEEAPMKSPFRKISRVGSLTSGTRWYLSHDCLLAAKRMMYSVEYRRFYLRDLESVVVWRNPLWWWRLTVPTVVFVAFGLLFWQLIDGTFGAIVGGIGLFWALLELALGPTAKSRIRITGATIDLPLVMRTRRARKVLAKIDAAVRASRGVVEPPSAPATAVQFATSAIPTTTTEASETASAAATQTNAS